MRRPILRSFIGTLLVGLFAAVPIVSESSFGLRARTGRAVVVESGIFGGMGLVGSHQGGRTVADVVHEVDGKPFKATLRAWYCHLRPGQRVDVLYLPGDPGEVVPDRFWQRHWASVAALTAFGVVAIREALTFKAWRRRQSSPLLRD